VTVTQVENGSEQFAAVWLDDRPLEQKLGPTWIK
jgi:hypothetical protein